MDHGEAARALFLAGSVPFTVAGAAHAIGALFDARRPTFFVPADNDLRARMQASRFRFRAMFPGKHRERPSMWHAWLGFNVSHGLGAAGFGLFCFALALLDFEVVRASSVIPTLALLVAGSYVAISVRFWFYGPTLLTAAGTTCFALSYLLM